MDAHESKLSLEYLISEDCVDTQMDYEELMYEVVKLRNENKYLHSLIDGATKVSPVELCFSYIDTQDSNTYCNICSLANNIGMEILDKKLYSESTRKDIWNPDNVEHVFRITLLPPIDNH